MSHTPEISLVVVSHRDLPVVERALVSLSRTPPRRSFEVVVIENGDPGIGSIDTLGGLPVRLIVNRSPVGLSRNLNRAVRLTHGEHLCIFNPDVEFIEDVVTPLADLIREGHADVVAPTILDRRGRVLPSARNVPRPAELIARRLTPDRVRPTDPSFGDHPAWLAGTFLLMHRRTFDALNGFDERYYLYFEDVDFGCRARLAGFRLMRSPSLRLLHEPAKRSRTQPRYFAWHLASAVRFFTSATYREALEWERIQAAAEGD